MVYTFIQRLCKFKKYTTNLYLLWNVFKKKGHFIKLKGITLISFCISSKKYIVGQKYNHISCLQHVFIFFEYPYKMALTITKWKNFVMYWNYCKTIENAW